jgi:indole-3-glycerol phosphate synthase
VIKSETTGILKEIVEVKQQEIERLKLEVPIIQLERGIKAQKPLLDFAQALRGDTVRIIAEVKKASPSRGVLRPDFDPVALATTYADNGAAAISVLTNADHFQGSIQHLDAVCGVAHPRGVPVLRKDFIFDPYQVYEARAYGADAILLIVAILTPARLRELRELATQLQMQCLVEVHDEEELKAALEAGAEVIGINNRDLRTFKTELEVTERLAPLIPEGKTIVSESGISNRSHIQRIRKAGAHAALIGESLVTAPDMSAKLRELTTA